MKCDSQTSDLLSLLSDKSRQQVELTINALCRSTRKAVRQAETCAPEAREAAWQEVERRCGTLRGLLDQLSAKKPETPTEPAPELQPASEAAVEVQAEADAELAPALELVASLQAESQRIAALPRKNIGQVRHARREEAKLLAKLKELQAQCATAASKR